MLYYMMTTRESRRLLRLLDGMQRSCPLGLTNRELDFVFGVGDRRKAFNHWMHGQTGSICEGRRYNHEAKAYEPDECADAPHGHVVYEWDVRRFIEGRPVID